jgi:hypothetical protein
MRCPDGLHKQTGPFPSACGIAHHLQKLRRIKADLRLERVKRDRLHLHGGHDIGLGHRRWLDAHLTKNLLRKEAAADFRSMPSVARQVCSATKRT